MSRAGERGKLTNVRGREERKPRVASASQVALGSMAAMVCRAFETQRAMLFVFSFVQRIQRGIVLAEQA